MRWPIEQVRKPQRSGPLFARFALRHIATGMMLFAVDAITPSLRTQQSDIKFSMILHSVCQMTKSSYRSVMGGMGHVVCIVISAKLRSRKKEMRLFISEFGALDIEQALIFTMRGTGNLHVMLLYQWMVRFMPHQGGVTPWMHSMLMIAPSVAP